VGRQLCLSAGGGWCGLVVRGIRMRACMQVQACMHQLRLSVSCLHAGKGKEHPLGSGCVHIHAS